MRLAKILCIILAVALVVCLPLTAYAQPPRRAIIYGTLMSDPTDNQSSHQAKITPVNNMVFGIYSETALDICTRVYLYFRFNTEIVTGFKLSLKLLSTQFQLGTQNALLTQINNIADTGVVTDALGVGSYTSITVDGDVITWEVNGNFSGRSGIQVGLIFQNFVIETTPMYFQMLDFSVNNLSVEEVEVSQYEIQFQERLERLEDIEDRAYQQGKDIPITDIQNYLARTDGDHYFGAFHYMFAQSTLLSTMVTVVCLFGIIGFIIYGKKV